MFSANSNTKQDSDAFDITPNIPEAEEAQRTDKKFRAYVERMRNVSRFPSKTIWRKYTQAVPTYTDPEAKYLKNPKYFMKVFALNGFKSGIDPGVAWPSKTQLQGIINEEKEFDLTLEQKVNMFIQKKQAEIQNIEKM